VKKLEIKSGKGEKLSRVSLHLIRTTNSELKLSRRAMVKFCFVAVAGVNNI
jgi:hypothetical protein